MTWAYNFDPYLWPAAMSAGLIAVLGWYSWRRRNVPGAQPFAIATIFGVLWIIGLALESAAIDAPAKIFWFIFQGVWQLPVATAITCFVLEYAGLGRWLTRRNLLLLSIPSLLVLGMILTNGLHHSMWQDFQVNQTVTPIRGPTYWASFAIGYTLAFLNIAVFIWLFIRSPGHRWPVALMLVGQIGSRTFYLLDTVNIAFMEPLSPIFLMFVFAFSIYAIAMFGFHVFDPVPVARLAVLQQMNEGMLVLDLQGRIADLNPAAEKILGKPATNLRGRSVAEVIPAATDILGDPKMMVAVRSEMIIEKGNTVRYYNSNLTPLMDRRSKLVGQLLLLHDITEQKQAQVQVVEQQRVLATLQERERLARELHDGVGQVLGYVSMQTQTARRYVHEGNAEKAESLLGRLQEVAKDAHADVRESILNLRTDQTQGWSFIPALKQYLENYQANYNIHTELALSGPAKEINFSPVQGAQMLRVIQEALTNARKHGGAHNVKLVIAQASDQKVITVTDDGSGFDTLEPNRDVDNHFGLAFMRERIEQIGGALKIESRPGWGTVVTMSAPILE